MHERGLDLTHFDILKSEVISTIPDGDRETCARKWEEEESALGRLGFSAAGSRRNRDFTPDERPHWRHRLANLSLLNRRKNTAAANYDFDVKKAKYFTSVNGVSSFALTTQVLTVDEWTPSVLEERQQQLLDTLAAVWSLR
ncbi:HNH endonuclease family protein [Actinokineospora sp. PR83]|uniref:HNH endonuclease family protein n=1 Tax=Actinokineospora sp. PR83 TaxID=2884908 RepID=UPI0027E082D9|nr:DUF1524 domain-containing protein [Actinokineospora sp. PR83]MCG8915802.1 HNH endonuclease family protein [Actinokineospora sp. PR83]